MSDVTGGDDAKYIVARNRELQNQMARREATRLIEAQAWQRPALDATSTLARDLLRPIEPAPFRVQGLLGLRHNATLVAGFKTGKTTLFGNLTKSLVDGTPFLDTFPVQSARVGFWNGEMDREDFTEYLRSMGIVNTEAVTVLHLRGSRVPLMGDAGREWAERWMVENNVQVWLNDSGGRLCAWSGVSENDNTAVADLTSTIDEIKHSSGVEQFLSTVHTGRSEVEVGTEHARGATALDDWVDARWVMTRKQGDRFLMVEGRRVALAETQLMLDPVTNLLSLGVGSRRERHVLRAVETVVAAVGEQPGMNVTQLRAAIGSVVSNSGEQSNAIRQAIESGQVVVRTWDALDPAEQIAKGKNSKNSKFHFLAGSGSPASGSSAGGGLASFEEAWQVSMT